MPIPLEIPNTNKVYTKKTLFPRPTAAMGFSPSLPIISVSAKLVIIFSIARKATGKAIAAVLYKKNVSANISLVCKTFLYMKLVIIFFFLFVI